MLLHPLPVIGVWEFGGLGIGVWGVGRLGVSVGAQLDKKIRT